MPIIQTKGWKSPGMPEAIRIACVVLNRAQGITWSPSTVGTAPHLDNCIAIWEIAIQLLFLSYQHGKGYTGASGCWGWHGVSCASLKPWKHNSRARENWGHSYFPSYISFFIEWKFISLFYEYENFLSPKTTGNTGCTLEHWQKYNSISQDKCL